MFLSELNWFLRFLTCIYLLFRFSVCLFVSFFVHSNRIATGILENSGFPFAIASIFHFPRHLASAYVEIWRILWQSIELRFGFWFQIHYIKTFISLNNVHKHCQLLISSLKCDLLHSNGNKRICYAFHSVIQILTFKQYFINMTIDMDIWWQYIFITDETICVGKSMKYKTTRSIRALNIFFRFLLTFRLLDYTRKD